MMSPDGFSSLDISRYQLCLRARRAVALAPFLGSAFRGPLAML